MRHLSIILAWLLTGVVTTSCTNIKPTTSDMRFVILGFQEDYAVDEEIKPVLQEMRKHIFNYWDSIAMVNQTILIDTSGTKHTDGYIAKFKAFPFHDQHLATSQIRFIIDLENNQTGKEFREFTLTRDEGSLRNYIENPIYLATYLQATNINQLVPMDEKLPSSTSQDSMKTFAIRSITYNQDIFTPEHKALLNHMINNAFLALEPHTERFNKVKADRLGSTSMITQIFNDGDEQKIPQETDHIFDFEVSFDPLIRQITIAFQMEGRIKPNLDMPDSMGPSIIFKSEPFFEGDYYESNAIISQYLLSLIRRQYNFTVLN